MKRIKRSSQAGFTIVELMVATLVFSVILVVITSGILHFTTAYYKGINSSATQTAARNVINIIAQNLQYGGGKDDYALTVAGTDGYLCIGSIQINYKLGGQQGTPGINYGAFVSKSPCGTAYVAGMAGSEYLGPNMRVTNLDVSRASGGANNLYKISVGVAYGDIDLLCSRSIATGSSGSCAKTDTTTAASMSTIWGTLGSTVACKSDTGSQFCSVSHLTTQVVSRFEPGS